MNKLPDKIQITIGPEGGIFVPKKQLSLVSGDDPILHSPCNPADITASAYLENRSLVETMLKICELRKGYGLSANQVGLSKRLFVLYVSSNSFNIDLAYFNPEVLKLAETSSVMEEGCLSYPFIEVKISRPDWVILQWFDINGNNKRATFHGMTARVILHEMDHLNGITIFDHLSPLESRLAREKQRKLLKKAKRRSIIK